MNRQNGFGAFDLIAAVVAVFFLVVYGYSKMDASDDAVKNVVAVAKVSPGATQAVTSFLVQHPTPSNGDLNQLKKQVNEQLVLENSKRVTGRPDLQAGGPVASPNPAATDSDVNTLVDLAFKGFAVLAVLMAITFAIPKVSAFMRGQS